MIPFGDRRAFIEDAVARTAEVLAAHQADRDRNKAGLSDWQLRGREGAIRELRARLEWLEEIRASL